MPEASDELADLVHGGLSRLNVNVGDKALEQLITYLSELQRWNRTYNLTARADPAEAARLHILDCAAAVPWLEGQVLDVGTGAGLPGLVLAVLEPGRSFTLLDSAGKKIRFVRHVVIQLELNNVTVVQARAESWKPGSLFDTVICRAYSSLADFISTAGALAGPGGRLLAMKGRQPGDELAELPAGWRASTIEKLEVPGLNAERHMIVLERN